MDCLLVSASRGYHTCTLKTHHAVTGAVRNPCFVVADNALSYVTARASRSWLIAIALTSSVGIVGFGAKVFGHSTETELAAASRCHVISATLRLHITISGTMQDLHVQWTSFACSRSISVFLVLSIYVVAAEFKTYLPHSAFASQLLQHLSLGDWLFVPQASGP